MSFNKRELSRCGLSAENDQTRNEIEAEKKLRRVSGICEVLSIGVSEIDFSRRGKQSQNYSSQKIHSNFETFPKQFLSLLEFN